MDTLTAFVRILFVFDIAFESFEYQYIITTMYQFTLFVFGRGTAMLMKTKSWIFPGRNKPRIICLLYIRRLRVHY